MGLELLFGLEGVLKAFVLILVRTSVLILTAPVLGFGTNFTGYKVAIIVGTSLVLYVALGEPLSADVDTVAYAMMVVREAMIGLFLGFLMLLVLLAVRVGGEMIGHEMGFLMARQVDPATGTEGTLIVTLYENLFLLAFLMLNGHHWLIRSLGASFERAPIGRVVFGTQMATTAQGMFTEMFGAGLVFAAPVLVFLTMVSVLIGILARAVPTLNVMELGFSLRVVISLAAMFLFAPLLEPAMTHLHGRFLVWLDVALDSLG